MFTHDSKGRAGTRRRVLAAAQKVLAEDGVARLRVSAVAREAGVAQGALYRHFAGREDLIVAAILDSVSSVSTLPEATFDSGDAARAGLTSLIDRVYRHEQKMASVVVTVLADEQLHRRFSQIMAEAPGGPENFTRRLQQQLEQLQQRGHLAAHIDTHIAAATVQARCFHHAMIQRLRAPNSAKESINEVVNGLVTELLATA